MKFTIRPETGGLFGMTIWWLTEWSTTTNTPWEVYGPFLTRRRAVRRARKIVAERALRDRDLEAEEELHL